MPPLLYKANTRINSFLVKNKGYIINNEIIRFKQITLIRQYIN